LRRRLDAVNSNDAPVSDRQAVMELMMATTLKDVSILIKFDSWPARDVANVEFSELPKYAIGIVDHDPKKVSNIPKYHNLDQGIIAAYLQHNPDIAGQRPCCE
ncbi:hypothetical protein IWW38_002734, partial [Coemansia aciculifera]